jgi:light-regulated signal transduction histidine kinase (bacteriophytochrome)
MQGQGVYRQDVTARSPVERQPGAPGAGAAPADHADRDAEEFALLVAHDLKQPLQGIRAYCEILVEDYEEKFDADGRRRLHALVTLCDRLAGSIDDLLEYSRAGQLRPTEGDVDLNAVVEDVVGDFRPIIESRQASVRVIDRLPVVKGDATMLGKVFANLIANGLKFNRSGSPSVEIGTLTGELPLIYVRDNGIGIAPEHHQEVFTIFRRLHSRREYEGSGAGLTIVRKIVESHGGRIWLESEPGRGTTFFFTLGSAPSEPTESRPAAARPHWIDRFRRRPSRA